MKTFILIPVLVVLIASTNGLPRRIKRLNNALGISKESEVLWDILDIANLTAAFDKMKMEFIEMRTNATQLQALVNTLENDLMEKNANDTLHANQIKSLENGVDQIFGNVTAISGQISILENGVLQNSGNITTIEAEINEVSANSSANTADITNLQVDVQSNFNSILNISADVVVNSANITVNANAINELNGLAAFTCPDGDANYRAVEGVCYFYKNIPTTHAVARQICAGTFEGTGRLYEPVSYAQAYHVQKEGYDSFNENDWWTGIRSSNGTCIFDDESPADCSLLEKDNNFSFETIPSSDLCLLLNTNPWQWYSCTDSTQMGTICEKSRDRN